MNFMPPIILHLDMNSYFASCEQQANPHLRGRPVGVCEHLGGIIIAPSVEAKRLGIKLGTTVWDARKICPDIVLLPVDPDKYRYITGAFLRILYDYTDKVEKYSIDEAFMDLSDICHNYNEALLLALEIKQRLRQEIGVWISCSIGIGPNKLVAKIAADLGDGDIDRICVIEPKDIPSLYERLELTDMPGIGKHLERAFNKLRIFSLQELKNYPLENLLNQFGIEGYILHQLARFEEPINGQATDSTSSPQAGGLPIYRPEDSIKSIGHSYTLPKPISNLNDIKKLMYKLSEKIGRRMRRQKAHGNVIHYFHSAPSFPPPYEGEARRGWFHKQHKIQDLINDGKDIYKAAFRIFSSNQHQNTAIKIMGISVSGLVFDFQAEPLFEEYKRPTRLIAAMDWINDKYGEFTISRARLINIDQDWAKDTVGFSRQRL